MSALYLALGLLFLGIQGVFYFMMAAFSVPGVDPKPEITNFINFNLYFLPIICAVSAALMFLGHFYDWKIVYVWTLLPIVFAILFLIIRFGFLK